ncbi:MAG: SPOR domain-containing protein [Draconibacterium sp.]|nr:SPOR domain-containing protein [Draconibacterium sp.]
MDLNKTNSFLTILFVLLFTPIFAISQVGKENVLSKAIRLFDKQNYTEAETLFVKVLNEHPDDFMVNYFYGACRTENNHFTSSDLNYLIKANKEVSPVDINYYFGIQYHARSNWERALKFYNKYNSTAPLSESEKQKLLEKIQQCYDKINPYKKYMVDENKDNIGEMVSINNSTNVDSLSEKVKAIIDTANINEIPINITSPASAEIIVEKERPTGEPIAFYINNEITYLNTSQFKTKEGKELFRKGDSKQKELDFTLKKVDRLRKDYANAKTREEKKSIGEIILLLENETYTFKNDATQFLFQAKNIESEYWRNASQEETEKFIQELNQISTQIEIEKEMDKETNIDSIPFIDPNILLGNNESILSPEKSTSDNLIYKIQIGAFSKNLPSYIKRLFKKLSLIRKIENYTDENGVVVYTTGNLTNYEDAVKMQNRVRQEGVKDAYIVPYFKRKRITLTQAKDLEKKR